jgi:hypothetical protein
MVDSWLNDNTANRHKQTYIKGFLDISGGDLILRNGQQYVEASYNYSTTDISDNSITSSQEITVNPVWSQLGHSITPVLETAATDTDPHYFVNYYIDMSRDGTVIITGERRANSNQGVVRVFQYTNGVWTQLGVDLSGNNTSDYFGTTVSINADGTIIAIGSSDAGYCKIFEYDVTVDGSWNQLGSDITSSSTSVHFGASVALDASGHRLAVDDQGYNSDTGYVEVYDYDGNGNWTQVGSRIDGPGTNAGFGVTTRLSGDGNRIIIGGAGSYNTYRGTVEVYEYTTDWNKVGTTFTGEADYDALGRYAVAISYDGSIITMGANQRDTNGNLSGTMYAYSYNTSTTSWDQLGEDIIGREVSSYMAGRSMDLSDDGTILSVVEEYGVSAHASDQYNTTAAVGFVYKYTNGAWKLLGQPIEYYNPHKGSLENSGCCISNDGTIFSIVQQGDLRVFELSQITNYVSNPTYKTTNRTGNYSIRLGDISNNDTALSITKNYTTVTHDISGTYSDSYTHYPLIGDTREPFDNIEPMSYKQLGIDISIDMNAGWCRLDASGTRLMAANNSGVNVYEYSHFTWTQLGSTIGLGDSNTALRCAAISGNGEYVATYASPSDYTVQVNKYDSSANTWVSYGTLGNGNGEWIDITHDGQTIIVGENFYNNGNANNGRATVWEYTGDGSDHSWTQVGLDIILYNGAQNRNGEGVSINKTGDIIVVGAIGYDGFGTDAGVIQAFKYSPGSTATNTGSGYQSHDDWEPLGSKIEPTESYDNLGPSIRMNDDGYTFASVSTGGASENRYVVVYRYSEESSDWYVYGYARSENAGTDYGDESQHLEISGDGEIVAVGAISYNNGMVRQYKVLNGKLEPVGPAFYPTSHDDLGLVGMSNDGKTIAMGAIVSDYIKVYQLNDVQQTITAHTYKNTETETQDYIHLGNKTSGNMLEIKGTSEITGDMTINSSGTYQYIDISHVPQSIVLMDENEVYHTDVSYNGALSGYYCAVPTGVRISDYAYEPYRSFQSLIGQASPEATYLPPDQTYSSGTYVGSVITSYKESKTDATYTDLSGEYLQFEFPFMIKPNEFNYVHVNVYWNQNPGSVNNTDISSGMLVGWDGTEWLKLTAIQQSDYNLYGVTKYDLSSNTHYMNKFRLIAHSGNGFDYVAIGAPYLSGTIRTGTVPSMAITSTDTDIKFNVTDLSMAGNLTIEANTFTLKNKDLNTDSDANLIKYFPQAVAGNYQMSTGSSGDDTLYNGSNTAGLWMANIIHHTGSNSHFNGGYLFEGSNIWSTSTEWSACNPFLYHTDNGFRVSARHFLEQTHSFTGNLVGWMTSGSKYDTTTGAYRDTTTTTFVDINGNTHSVGGEYLELHTPLPMKYKKFHYLSNAPPNFSATQKVMFVGKKNDIYYQLSYPQTLLKETFYNDVDLDRTDIFVSSIRIIVLEVYDGYSTHNTAFISQLSFDAIPSIDTHLEITNNQFGTVFNAYDKGAKGNIILNEAPHFNKAYLMYEQDNSWYDSTTSSSKLLSNPTGYVGIGTNKPVAPLTVFGYGGFNSYRDDGFMLMYSGSQQQYDDTFAVIQTDATIATGLYSIYSIRSMSYIIAHGGIMLASDERIKKNVKDIDDGEALGILRTLKPKTYEYINKINRNETGHVYGFMAQDVSAALPYSVKIEREYVPNIYELADISNGNIVLTKNTTDAFTKVPELDASGNAMQDASGNTIYRLKNKTLKCMTLLEADFEVTIKEIVDENRFTIKESLTLEQTTHVDISGNPLKNKLFVLGEVVDDFHVLNKEAIWTISTAALQEIDRSVQAEETSTQTMEAQIAALLADVEALENA